MLLEKDKEESVLGTEQRLIVINQGRHSYCGNQSWDDDTSGIIKWWGHFFVSQRYLLFKLWTPPLSSKTTTIITLFSQEYLGQLYTVKRLQRGVATSQLECRTGICLLSSKNYHYFSFLSVLNPRTSVHTSVTSREFLQRYFQLLTDSSYYWFITCFTTCNERRLSIRYAAAYQAT